MKRDLEIAVPIIVIIAGALLIWALFTGQPISQPIDPQVPYGPRLPQGRPAQPAAQPTVQKPPSTPVMISEQSPEIFAYAHGSVTVHGKIFIGMAARSGNPFSTNQLFVFTNPANLREFRIISIRRTGDIESMVYDEKNDKIYFTLSNNGSLEIYRIDPNTYFLSTVISTTSVNIGLKPAITTDGKYIYGISYTRPSTVFKVGIYGTPLMVSTIGHVTNGHSAAVATYGSTTEVYFGGGEDDGFEKVDGATLDTLGMTNFPGCSLTDDMPYMDGYVYVGCERQPYGYRIKTDDMSVTRFALPGNSFGMNIFGNDLYNAAQDGNFDIFPNMDIFSINRYYVGRDIQLNELFVVKSDATVPQLTSSMSASSTEGNSIEPADVATSTLLFTGWWGVKGLFRVNLM